VSALHVDKLIAMGFVGAGSPAGREQASGGTHITQAVHNGGQKKNRYNHTRAGELMQSTPNKQTQLDMERGEFFFDLMVLGATVSECVRE
jgi:hypothetical protein